MRLILILCFVSYFAFGQKSYQINYDIQGKLTSEGWVNNGQKIKYWKTYYPNGALKSAGHYTNNAKVKFWRFYYKTSKKQSEGHFKNGTKTNWWVFFDINGRINHKCQLQNNQKNGYCLHYENKKMVRAEKYKAGKKLKEWTDYSSFRKENNLSDLN